VRILRVSELRGSKYGKPQSEPKEGTKSRKLWDAIHDGPINIKDYDFHASKALRRFGDFYGLETVRIGNGIYEIDHTK
jgi:hypothetical protein